MANEWERWLMSWWKVVVVLVVVWGGVYSSAKKSPIITVLGGSRPSGVGCFNRHEGSALWECAWPAYLKRDLPSYSITNRAYPLGSPLHLYYTWGLALDQLTEFPDMIILDFHPHHWLKIGKYQQKALIALIKHLQKFPDLMVIALVSPLPLHLTPGGIRRKQEGGDGGFEEWVEKKESAWLEREGKGGEWEDGKDWIWWFYLNSFVHVVEVSAFGSPQEIAQRVSNKVTKCFNNPSSCINHSPPPSFPYNHLFNFKDISFPPAPPNSFPTDHVFPFSEKLSIFRQMSEKIWEGDLLMFKFMIRPHLSIQAHAPGFGYVDGSSILRGELPSRYLGKLTGIDSYLWEKLVVTSHGPPPLEPWEKNWGDGMEEPWKETCEEKREGAEPTFGEMGEAQLDFSVNSSSGVKWRGEGGGEEVGAHICLQVKRLSHPCDCVGNQKDFVMHVYDPVDNPDYQKKEKFTDMMYVSNLKHGAVMKNKPTYVMPHWHTNYENQVHEKFTEGKLKVFFAGEQRYSSLSNALERDYPSLLGEGEFIYESYPKKSVTNSWALQRILHENANQADIIVVSRNSRKGGFFQTVLNKPALRMFNAWSHRQPVVFSNEWSYYEFSNFWFGQMPSIVWNTDVFAARLAEFLGNRTYLEKVATMGYSVVPLFGDSLIHHYPLSVCHNWKMTRKGKGVKEDRMSSVCEYLDELLEYTNPHTPLTWTHEIFAPGGPIFGKIDLENDDLRQILDSTPTTSTTSTTKERRLKKKKRMFQTEA